MDSILGSPLFLFLLLWCWYHSALRSPEALESADKDLSYYFYFLIYLVLYVFIYDLTFYIKKRELRKMRYGVLVCDGVSACCLLAKIPKKWRCCIHGVIILSGGNCRTCFLSIHSIPAVEYSWRSWAFDCILFFCFFLIYILIQSDIILPTLSNSADWCRQKGETAFWLPVLWKLW